MKQKYDSGVGFTLVELLVVVGVIVILTAIILPNYRSATSQFALERSAHKMSQDIRRAAEMAMSAKELPGGGIPVGGYGIFFNIGTGGSDKKYILFADTDPLPDGNGYFSGSDIPIEEIELEKGVVIQSINTPNNRVGINFKPPAPTVRIKFNPGPGASVDTTIITLALESGPTKTIKVNKAGLIDVE